MLFDHIKQMERRYDMEHNTSIYGNKMKHNIETHVVKAHNAVGTKQSTYQL